jgi:hypothetical protein
LQVGGGFFDVVARGGVDDAGLAATGADDVEDAVLHLRGPTFSGEHEIGAIEAIDEGARVFEFELRADVGLGFEIGGGGDGHARHAGEAIRELAERAIVGPEVMAPLADAVRFVDGDERDRALFEEIEEALREEAFGRDVEEIELAFACGVERFAACVGLNRGI